MFLSDQARASPDPLRGELNHLTAAALVEMVEQGQRGASSAGPVAMGQGV